MVFSSSFSIKFVPDLYCILTVKAVFHVHLDLNIPAHEEITPDHY